MAETVKIIQIVAAQWESEGQLKSSIIGLGDDGQPYRWNREEGGWHPYRWNT